MATLTSCAELREGDGNDSFRRRAAEPMRAERKCLFLQVAGRDFRKNCAGASLAQLVEHSAQPQLPCALAEIRISLASYVVARRFLAMPRALAWRLAEAPATDSRSKW